VITGLSSPTQVELLRHNPEMIVVNGSDLKLRDAIRGISDANRFPPIPAGADDSRFRIEGPNVFCSDDPLFPRSALRLPTEEAGLDLCVALAVLDGMGIDVVSSKSALASAVSAFEPPPTPEPSDSVL
jgi:UDP-N-acetylmuramoyl-L-alanine---L-glutamate ligase